jgi:hypothetical protein
MEQEQRMGSEQDRKDSKRKLYTKPSFMSEKIYETVALACGKLPGQGGSCNGAPSRS